MAKNNIKSKKGFTIIEVVLVLAIAGLIFLMVFVALPALQRNQRDTQRRDDYGMLSSAITNYSASNGGKVFNLAGVNNFNASGNPKSLDSRKYINENGQNPNRKIYDLKVYTWGMWSSASTPIPKDIDQQINSGELAGNKYGSQVFVVLSANCEGVDANGGAAPKKADNSSFAVYGYVESGNGTYCSASHT